MKVAIISYNAGNIFSIKKALERQGVDAFLSADFEEISKADKVIFPGVGHAAAAMNNLKEKGLDELIPNLKQDVLGICLGMQLMCNYTEEGNLKALGIFDANVKRIVAKENIKVPHTGWNQIYDFNSSLYKGIDENSYVYFVHSYAASLSHHSDSKCLHGEVFSSSLHKNNFYGVQYHPEKSSVLGEKIISNFLKL